MRLLITGGAGFIGSHIADEALEQGHSVSVVDDLSIGSVENVDARARLYTVDITDGRAVEEVVAREMPEMVSHHAAQTDVRRSMADPAFDARVNILGTINLLEASAKHDVERFIFASTSAVYTEPENMPMDESHPVGPQSGYGVSKYASESYIRVFAEASGLRYKIFRYGNVYGPRQNPKGEAGVVAIFCGQFLAGVQPRIFGDGTKTRDYIYVGDVAAANIKAMGEAGDGEVFNLARGVEVSDFEIFESVRKAMGASIGPSYAPKRPGEADRVSLDSSKAAGAFDWRPATGLVNGIAETAAYYHYRDSAPK